MQYIPREDADPALLKRTERSTHCPYKGDATYYSIEAGGRRAENAIWSYETPYPGHGRDRRPPRLLPRPRRPHRGGVAGAGRRLRRHPRLADHLEPVGRRAVRIERDHHGLHVGLARNLQPGEVRRGLQRLVVDEDSGCRR